MSHVTRHRRIHPPSRRRLRGFAACSLALLHLAVAATAQQVVYRYTLEVATERKQEVAQQIATALQAQLGAELPVRLEVHRPFHVVRVGYFASAAEAERVIPRLRELGFDPWIAATAVNPDVPVWREPAATRTDQDRPQRSDTAPRDGSAAEAGVVVEPPDVAAPRDATTAPPIAEQPAPPPAAGAPAAPPPAGPKQMVAVRVSGEAPKIDGRLDDPAWSGARFVSDFEQKGARRGFPPPEPTEVAFLFDSEALYVGARVGSREPAAVHANTSRRDDPANADRLVVSLDTYHNRETAYSFGVTAGGTRLDWYQPADVFEARDASWDPVWDAAAAPDPAGWTAEMRIPFSSLEFHDRDPLVFGVNVARSSPGQRVYTFWVVVPQEQSGWASRFGDLVGLEGVRPRRRVSFVPYVTGQSIRSDFAATTGDPFGLEDDMAWDYGGDLVADLGRGLSVEGTINPDFGQIEQDPAVVNLTAYEVFLPEKRPFFAEDADLFTGRGPRYYYSRRIGAAPHGEIGDGVLAEPVGTTILGAAKLVGRRPSGWSVGSLVAASDDEATRTYDPNSGAFGEIPIEPQTWYTVNRLQRDLGAGSTFGIVGTGVFRELDAGDPLSAILPRQAYTLGADWNLRFAQGSHEAGAFVGGSWVEGETPAMQRLQGSSARYFERPDADYVELDPTRTTLSGYTAGLNVDRVEGKWQWSLSAGARSPGFEINDVGAMATADDMFGFAQLRYGAPRKPGLWHRVDMALSALSDWNFGGVRQLTTFGLDTTLVWRNFWKTWLRLGHDLPALSDSLTRGGPLMATEPRWSAVAGLATNDARRHYWALDGSFSRDELGSRSYGAATRLIVRPTDHLTVSLGPGYERSVDARQYFDTVEGGGAATFGRRYVFAELDQTTVYARLRAAVALTPRVGLDLYVEPFAASGRYTGLGELAAARTSDLRLYGTDGSAIVRLGDGSYVVADGDQTFLLGNGDFDVSSLRGNAVLHWEYAPGSTLYLVWSENSAEDDLLGQRAEPRDLVEAFDTPGETVFAIKASYRFDVD
jgi:hypothetical protein